MMIVFIVATSFFTAFMFYRMLAPLFERVDPDALELLDDDMRRLEELVAQRALVMHSLAELEQDLELEKLTQEDYTQLKRRYQRQVINIMKQLDAIHGGREWESKIDEELDLRRTPQVKPTKKKKTKKPKKTTAPQPTETLSTIACTECGHEMSPKAKFCSECGTPTQQLEVVAKETPSPAEVTP